jgi:hypothetical protein
MQRNPEVREGTEKDLRGNYFAKKRDAPSSFSFTGPVNRAILKFMQENLLESSAVPGEDHRNQA